MDINLSKLWQWLTIMICVGIFGFSGYLGYVVFFTGEKPDDISTLANVNVGLFSSKVRDAAAVLTDSSKKIQIDKKSFSFTESALYKSFVDLPVDVPLSDSRGRPDPFVPYASP